MIKSKIVQIPFIRRLIETYHRFRERRLLVNVNHVSQVKELPRALLVYITRPFLIDRNSSRFLAHQNNWCAVEIARLLGELGYVVDVINYDDYTTKISNSYNLLIGSGLADDLTKRFPPQTIKIHLALGSQVGFMNHKIQERVAEIYQKRGCKLQPIRSDESENLTGFDAIACIGNEVVASTFRPYFKGKIYSWNNHGYDQWFGLPDGKSFTESRQNFLYFASAGQVLIGLDLILEVFVQRPHLNLFVCGPFAQETDFVECFHKEIYETPNITPVGWVKVGTQKYFELVKKCGCSVFPISAGGSPGSVVVTMGQGLIPIVSKESGITTEDFGITLPANTTEEIGKAVDWVSSQSAQWHEETTHKVLKASQQDFSQVAFTKRFREILISVIKDKSN